MPTSIVTTVSKPRSIFTIVHGTEHGRRARRHRLGAIIAAIVAAAIALTGCVDGQIPEVPPLADGTRDPQLVAGRTVWADHCVRCHGAEGNGGRGPKLSNGAVAIKYTNADVQISIISQGLNGKMPGFSSVLSAEEIEAVTAFTRSVL